MKVDVHRLHRVSHCQYTSAADAERTLKSICRDLGVVYQMRDDLNDAYKSRPDKTPRDIEDGKCTWLIAEAIQRADEDQKAVLRTAYGREDGRLRVLQVFDALDIKHRLEQALSERKDHMKRRLARFPRLFGALMPILSEC